MKLKVRIISLISFLLVLGVFFVLQINKKDDYSVVKFSSWGSQSEVKVINSVIKNFEKENPDIKIDFVHIPQNYFQKLQLLFASGLEPDVLFVNNQNIQLYIKAGLLEDISKYFKNSEKNFFEVSLNCFKDGDSIYAIPRDVSNLVIYYNKDIFDKAGVKIPSQIKNIYELKNLLKYVSNENQFGINYEEEPLYWLYYLSSNGGGVISDDKKSVIINSAKSIEAINLYADMVKKDKIIPTKAQVGSMTSAQMFINGKLAMYLSGRWMVPAFRNNLKFDWDIIEFPASSENKVYVDASGWAISKKSKNKEAAVKFISYLSSKEVSEEFTKIGLIVPARKDVANSSAFLNGHPDNSIAFIKMLVNAKPTPVVRKYSSVNDILKEEFQSIFNENKRTEEIFNDSLAVKLERLL